MAATGDGKSYLAETLGAFSPWSSRSATPRQPSDGNNEAINSPKVQAQRGGDHQISYSHGLSLKSYPKDCPKLDVQWFHAVDVPKRKPSEVQSNTNDEKETRQPKKWNAFSAKDSKAIEHAFQTLSEKAEDVERQRLRSQSMSGDLAGQDGKHETSDPKRQASGGQPSETVGARPDEEEDPLAKVPVNEDYLFDVDIKNRELGPAYWVGPVYEVRRGSWFFVEGNTLRPCDENLAVQLEEGYLKTKPWNYSGSPQPGQTTFSQPSGKPGDVDSKAPEKTQESPQESKPSQPNFPSHRLFGSHMNSVVTYQDATTAWIVSDDFLSRMSSTMYQRFAGGGHLSGTKVIRGYLELSKKKKAKDVQRPSTPTEKKSTTEEPTPDGHLKRHSIPKRLATEEAGSSAHASDNEPEPEPGPEPRVRKLERQMSSLVESANRGDTEKQDEIARKRQEREIRDDYRESAEDDQDRPIEHLVLITHGIGQRLGARFESFNFIHDVNEMRKTLKSVYKASEDLQALNSEVESKSKNCRIQVLPIVWRRHLDFPKHGLREIRKEHDLGDIDSEEDELYPSLDDITVEGVPALRNILVDLALDVLLYQTPSYKDHISRIVAHECNRICKLFKKRNPSFNGKISLVGHSLGSAIMFDLLSDQEDDPSPFDKSSKSMKVNSSSKFEFEVEDFYCVGSPIGLFQMLKGRTIAGRTNMSQVTLDGSSEGVEDPFQDSLYSKNTLSRQADSSLDSLLSRPKCRQLFNIFHPTDPVSYRMEPLISPAMSSMKPQPLPYTKKSLFGAPMGQGLTGIPAKVGQSFSGFWSNFSSGIANNFINRSLGISAEDAAKMGASAPTSAQPIVAQYRPPKSTANDSAGAGTNIVSGGVLSPEDADPESKTADDGRKRKIAQDTIKADEAGRHPPTLIDSELDTLYAGFQKRRKARQESDASLRDLGESPAWWEAEQREAKLKKEEAKLRRLNSNGRVDYSIQEGAFDISFLASIASHLAYWTDEDVCHFMTSQLLSRQRTLVKSPSA